MKATKLTTILRSATLSVALSFAALSGTGCGPGEEGAPLGVAQASDTTQAALNVNPCLKAYQTCMRRCQNIELRGGDSSQCESDCGATLNACGCDLAPYQCVFE